MYTSEQQGNISFHYPFSNCKMSQNKLFCKSGQHMTEAVEWNVIYLQACDVDKCEPSIPNTLHHYSWKLAIYTVSLHDKVFDILDYYSSVYVERMNTTQ